MGGSSGLKMICEGNGHISPAPEKVPYKFTPSLPLGCHSGILSEAGSLAEQSVGTAGQSSSCWQRQPRSPGAGGCEGRLTISPGCPGPGLRWLRAGRQPRNVCAQLRAREMLMTALQPLSGGKKIQGVDVCAHAPQASTWHTQCSLRGGAIPSQQGAVPGGC